MRKLTATLCLTIAVLLGSAGVSASADGLKMKPLTKMLSEETSLANTSTYLLRCISLYRLNSAWLQSNRKAEIRIKGKELSKVVEGMLEILLAIDKTQTLGGKPSMSFFKTQIEIMETEYSKMMNRSKALTGSVFDDPIVRSDMMACKNYQQTVSRVLDHVSRRSTP
jgi:hypothetical protein